MTRKQVEHKTRKLIRESANIKRVLQTFILV